MIPHTLPATTGIERRSVRMALVATALMLAACSIIPFRLFGSPRATPQPAIDLRRCDEVQDVLCLVTFGLEPPDQMLIVLLTTTGLPARLEAVATHNEDTLSYACESTDASPIVVYCAGPQIPLGSTVRIDVFAMPEQILLASGEFVLAAFALPTVPVGGVTLPTLIFPTPRPTRTPFLGTAYPNPGSSSTPTRNPIRTPTPTRTATATPPQN